MKLALTPSQNALLCEIVQAGPEGLRMEAQCLSRELGDFDVLSGFELIDVTEDRFVHATPKGRAFGLRVAS